MEFLSHADKEHAGLTPLGLVQEEDNEAGSSWGPAMQVGLLVGETAGLLVQLAW